MRAFRTAALLTLALLASCERNPTEPSRAQEALGPSFSLVPTPPGVIPPLNLHEFTNEFERISLEDINDMGVIVGSGRHVETGQRHALRFFDGEWQDLGNTGTQYCVAMAISSSGQIAGYCRGHAPSSGSNRWFLWEEDEEGLRDLGPPPFGDRPGATYPVAMNDVGSILGMTRVANPRGRPSYFYRPIVWRDENFEVPEVPEAVQNPNTGEWLQIDDIWVADINNKSQVTVRVTDFVYDNPESDRPTSQIRMSGILEGGEITLLQDHYIPPNYDASNWDLNDLGQVAGWAKGPDGGSPLGFSYEATVWTVHGDGIVDVEKIGRPERGIHAWARDINNRGDVLVNSNPGWYQGPPWNQNTSWIWDGAWTRLGDLGNPYSGEHTVPHAINNSGVAIGFSSDANGVKHPVAWGLVLSPEAQLRHLANQIETLLEAGVIAKGEANSLTSKIDAALRQIEAGNAGPAINQMGAFINQVEALVRSGRLSEEDAQTLIDGAQSVIDQLGEA